MRQTRCSEGRESDSVIIRHSTMGMHENPWNPHALTALSPLDGRYAGKTEALRSLFSEYGLMRQRVRGGTRLVLGAGGYTRHPRGPAPHRRSDAFLTGWADRGTSTLAAAARIKEIESTTNHDMKAVEYYLKEQHARNRRH